MTSPRHSETAGLYVHLPFCRKKCLYCNFLTAPLSRLVDPYLAAVQREARNAAAAAGDAWPEFDTVYLGGGTPSLLPPDRIAALLAALRETFPVSPAAEITLESNPEDVTATAAAAWRAAGVNRVTVGVQTTHAPTLERMQRDGGPAAVRAAVAVLREAGIDNVALDLIAGLPGDAAVHWEESLRFALALAPPHLSLYLLDVPAGPLAGAGPWQPTTIWPISTSPPWAHWRARAFVNTKFPTSPARATKAGTTSSIGAWHPISASAPAPTVLPAGGGSGI
jgi:oxygen-independent coproporphyrinogen-3 oxidase